MNLEVSVRDVCPDQWGVDWKQSALAFPSIKKPRAGSGARSPVSKGKFQSNKCPHFPFKPANQRRLCSQCFPSQILNKLVPRNTQVKKINKQHFHSCNNFDFDPSNSD